MIATKNIQTQVVPQDQQEAQFGQLVQTSLEAPHFGATQLQKQTLRVLMLLSQMFKIIAT